MTLLTRFFSQVSGKVVDWDRLSRTKVYVLKGIGRHFREDTRLSHYYGYTPLSRVTHGKKCGASHDEYNVGQEFMAKMLKETENVEKRLMVRSKV